MPRRAASEWRRAAADGALVGLVGAVAFFVLHALIVEPIWRAAPRGLLALANGALVGVSYHRLRPREEAFRHPLGGMLLGALAGLALAPFAVAGWMRARGAPDPFWILILALLATSVYHVTQAVQSYDRRMTGRRVGWRARVARLELPAVLLAINALPAYFLTFIADFHEETPEPMPFVLAVATIYVACGALLTMLSRRRA